MTNSKELHNGPGVYAIVNKLNGKMYIGSSINCRRRHYEHCSCLRQGKHFSPYLQRSWDKYGEKNFTFVVLCCVFDKNQIRENEQYFLDLYKPIYNCSLTANPFLGKKHSPESIAKIKIARSKQVFSQETREKMRQNMLGCKMNFSQEVLRAISERAKKMDRSYMKDPEYIKKLSKAIKKRMMAKAKPFMCLETGEIFRSTSDAAEKLGICSYKSVWRCLTKKRRTCGGYTFCYL